MVSTLVDKERVKYANRESRGLREGGGTKGKSERENVWTSPRTHTLSCKYYQ